ncbi:N-acetyl-gamma-glutamyl-phosphate reductase, partial [Enterobacter quasiroggenkampii]|nr:N-acetyl-gamma-glutamyl-phosphate reductase [Enterobacter quasiroggenkampii]
MFTATPSGVSGQLVPKLLKAGLAVIDLSGDFRIKDGELYTTWYKHAAPPEEWLAEAKYGLCELYPERGYAEGRRFISNPGCYPTATLLGLIPALQAGWIQPDSLII